MNRSQRAMIIQPGAVGDCILTLPLAEFLKSHLRVSSVEMLGHSDYISYFPGRTAVDTVRSLDSVDLHRLFSPARDFDLDQRDELIRLFAGYSYIISFLGEPESDFEQNLIFTANCSQGTEVMILPLRSDSLETQHISEYYINNVFGRCCIDSEPPKAVRNEQIIKPLPDDSGAGRSILKDIDINSSSSIVLLCPGSGAAGKCWHLDNFIDLAKAASDRGMQAIFLLGPTEMERFDKEKLSAIRETAPCVSDLSLNQVTQLLSLCDGFVGNDSGITHLAANLGLRTVALFGPTDPDVYRPIGPDVTVVRDEGSKFGSVRSDRILTKVLESLSSE